MNKRVMVAMSGGVDSSVAALLLKEQGYDVVGVTMCFNIRSDCRRRPGCCGPQAIADARKVARDLKIRHYVLPFSKELEENVVLDFINEYLSGRTPNPCVRCNQSLKFGLLLSKASAMGFFRLATGHYARIEKQGLAWRLKKGVDRKKDQSYFLCQVNRSCLRYVLFPLGSLTKEETRRIAAKKGLPVADKKGSQEICFIPGNDYRAFLKQRLNAACYRPGDIVDTKGSVLGRHNGIFNYTIGQREGLGISGGSPLYVNRLDEDKNRVIVGGKDEVYSACLFADELNTLVPGNFKKIQRVEVKIRYNHPQTAATAFPLRGRRLKVEFERPQPAVTPGQFAAFYDGDFVTGGAKIIENNGDGR